TWILYSFDVKMDGENACRLSDKKFQNHENTADLGGEIQAMLSPEEFEDLCENCRGQAKQRQEENETISDAYDMYADNPKYKTGPEVTEMLAGGPIDNADAGVTAGNYNPATDKINVNPDPDTECGPLLHDKVTEIHEKVHQERRN